VVRLKIRVRLSDGSRPFLDPVPAPKGRLKPLCAIVNGTPEHHPEGVYFLRYAKNNKRVWEAVGDDAQIALDAKRRKERVLAAIAAGVTVVENDSAEEASPKPEKAPAAEAGTLLSDAIGEYLTEVGLQKAPATYVAYEHTLRLFRTSCKDGQQLEQLERKDLLAFMAKLKTDGKEARTVANHISFLKVFFRRYGVAWPLLKTDKVKYTQKVISAYSKDELRKLLEVADTDEADLTHFFVATGARDLEVAYATWPDVSFHGEELLDRGEERCRTQVEAQGRRRGGHSHSRFAGRASEMPSPALPEDTAHLSCGEWRSRSSYAARCEAPRASRQAELRALYE
jgi:hypothetical protein